MQNLTDRELEEILAPKGQTMISPSEMVTFFKDERKISFKKLATALGVTRQQLYEWVKNGTIPDNRQRDLISIKSRILLWESQHNRKWGMV